MNTDTQTQSRAAAHLSEIHCLIKDFELAAEDNPRHPTMRLALQLAKRLRLDGGDQALTHADLEGMVSEINVDATLTRAQYNAEYMGDMDIDHNIAQIEADIEALARNDDGTLKPFEDFMRDTTGIHEVVLTGHPVFGMHPDKAQALAEHAAHLAGDKTPRGDTLKKLLDKIHLVAEKPTLNGETNQAHGGMRNGHAALSMVEDAHIRVAKRLYPKQWMYGVYRPGRLGTWLKLDRDGRKDVTEFDSLSEYLTLQTMMFDDHAVRLTDLESMLLGADQSNEVRKIVTAFRQTEKNLVGYANEFGAYNKNKDNQRLDKLADLATRFHEDGDLRVKHPGKAIAILATLRDELAADPVANDAALTLTVKMISRLSHHGLAYAHAQFRVNSDSVSAAVAEQTDEQVIIKGSGSDDNKYTLALDEMIKATTPEDPNLINVAQSKQTLTTQMMLIRQIRDECDEFTPIHFLTAETHYASTVLGAIYVAKRVGVYKHVNVIGLLEDRQGADDGGKIMEILMNLDSYMEHALGDRPHNPFQVGISTEHGYSDFIRYDGFSPAASFQEQAKVRIVGHVAEYVPKYKIPRHKLQLLVFDTQGQYFGRYQNPLSMARHHAGLNSPYFLAKAEEMGVHLILQKSAQGQDGIILELGTPAAALRNMALAIAHRAHAPKFVADDVFYLEGQNVKALHKDARRVHDAVTKEKGYKSLLAEFSPSLPVSGSRPPKGTYDAVGASRTPTLPRAIVDNGTKTALGAVTHMFMGLGSAINDNGTLYEKLATKSPHYRRQYLTSTMYSMERSDPGITRSYVELRNPSFWTQRAKSKTDESERAACYYIADHQQKENLYPDLVKQADTISREYDHVQRAHENLKLDEDRELDHPNLRPSVTQRYNTQVLHGIKLAAMIDMFERVAQIPDVAADRNGVDKSDLLARVMNFDETALSLIDKIYESSNHMPKIDLPSKPSTITFKTSYADVSEDITMPAQRDMKIIKDAARPLQSYYMGVG